METNKKEGETILCECCKNYSQGFNKHMKKEKGEIIAFVLHGKMVGSSWSQAEISLVVEGTK